MMLKELRERVYEANMDLPRHGLVVSYLGQRLGGWTGERGLFAVKPSGVDYGEPFAGGQVVVCDLDGNVVEGDSTRPPTPHARLPLARLGGRGRHRPYPFTGGRRGLAQAGAIPVLRHHAGRLLPTARCPA